jgi:hypothetical protein
MTRRDRLNRLVRAERDRAHIDKFLDPHGVSQPEPEQNDEQDDRPAEQVNPAQEPKKLRKLGWTPPELTPER